jgi:hypothetical protein
MDTDQKRKSASAIRGNSCDPWLKIHDLPLSIQNPSFKIQNFLSLASSLVLGIGTIPSLANPIEWI